MDISMKAGIVAVCVCMCLSGCSNKTELAIESETEANITIAESKNIDQQKTMTFPEFYSEERGKLQFECQLEIPNEFNASNFQAPIIKGISYMDSDLIYEKYVDGEIVSEEYHDPPTDENVEGNDTYILDDGTLIGSTGGMLYYKPQAAKYRTVVRNSERSAPKDSFSFATGDECVEQLCDELKEIGCPIDEYQFNWFSNSGEDYSIMEQRAINDGQLETANANQNGWTDEDNSYEIYGWQTYEGLQVLPWTMTNLMTRAIENYQKAPISALCTKQGMLTFSVTHPPYVFEASNQILEFLPFTAITDVLEQKYNDMLGDDTYSVTRAKLTLRTYRNENDEFAAEPVWYFEVFNNEKLEIVLINAVTGDEIYLN